MPHINDPLLTPCACPAVATDNFVEDVHGGFQCEVQKPYVLYRNRANEVRCGLPLGSGAAVPALQRSLALSPCQHLRPAGAAL